MSPERADEALQDGPGDEPDAEVLRDEAGPAEGEAIVDAPVPTEDTSLPDEDPTGANPDPPLPSAG